ncbi:MAG TPA: PP0621 family protein [Paraburkholderia sp.]|jgi:uncharacterized protein
MRQIFLLVLLFVVAQWFMKTLRRVQQTHTRPGDPQQASRRAANGSAAGGAARSPASLPEPMVRCTECGVHAPHSESVSAAGQSFCCDEHARQYAARVSRQNPSQGEDRAAR